jgi:integrase/recombinase XerD
MSTLSQIADDYLQLRRALGHKLDDAGRLLPRLVAYLEAIGAETITLEAALAWSEQPDLRPDSTIWARRLTVARGFARHLAGIYPHTQVPPVGMLPYHKHRRIPHLYSSADVAALMTQAHLTIPSPLRAATFETLIGMLAVTGMRIGEAIRLDRSDIDWGQSLAVVRASKFGKSRALPLQTSTVKALADYAQRRDKLQPSPKTGSFFVTATGKRLRYGDVQFTFQVLVSSAEIGLGSPVRPRIHDLRHSFAVRTLVEWYRNGENVQTRLAWLTTYMGHADPRFTYWYLSASSELLALAAGRLNVSQGVQP